jgi:hypothetical protein
VTEGKWEIWQEGFAATGEGGPAQKLGEATAPTFEEACQRWVDNKKRVTPDFNNRYGEYDPERNTIWGCRLYSNERDARRTFG